MEKKKIGFFGGCFNPPSKIHIKLARELVENKLLDSVIFVPVGDYYKKSNLVKADYRYNMLLLACKSYSYLKVEDIASKSEKNLYAVDTFELIYKKYNNLADIYLIMGSDNFKKMSNWKSYDNIKNKYKYIVIERPSYKEKITAENVIYYELDQKEDFSSTKIRHLLEKGEDTSEYLEPEVIEYIKANGLYNH